MLPDFEVRPLLFDINKGEPLTAPNAFALDIASHAILQGHKFEQTIFWQHLKVLRIPFPFWSVFEHGRKIDIVLPS